MKYIVKGIINLIFQIVTFPVIPVLFFFWFLKLSGGKRLYNDDIYYTFIEKWIKGIY